MTVSTTENFTNYLADGIVDTFSFSFQAQNTGDMVGLIDAIVDPNTTTLLNADQENNPGGTVKFNGGPPATGVTVTVLRQVSITQEVDYQEYDPFPAETHEGALDKLTMEVQQLAEEVSRAPKSSIDSGIVDYDLGNPLAEKLIMYKSDESGQVESGFTAQELMDESGGDIVSATPPVNPNVGDGWWDTAAGKAFIWYDDGGSQQWVERIPVPQSSDVFDAKLDGYQIAGTHIQYSDDVNDIVTNSTYKVFGGTATNLPSDFGAGLWGFLTTFAHTSGFSTQSLYGMNGTNRLKQWRRSNTSGAWEPWILVVDGGAQKILYGEVNINGNTITRSNGGVVASSNGVGDVTLIMNPPQPDTDYVVQLSIRNVNGFIRSKTGNYTAGSFDVSINDETSTPVDAIWQYLITRQSD